MISASLNRSAQALFGYEDTEMVGEPFQMLFAIESRPAANDYLQSLADNGITSVLNDGRELIACEKQGRFIPVFMTMGRLQESSGYCAVLRDITQFKRTEMELEHARKKAEKGLATATGLRSLIVAPLAGEGLVGGAAALRF